MNSYKLTLRKIESLAEASFHDALLAVILVTTMLFRVFSRSLDLEKTWYALNDRLCGKQPRKFSEGSFFQLFPDEFLRVNFADLHDENGCTIFHHTQIYLETNKSLLEYSSYEKVRYRIYRTLSDSQRKNFEKL